MSTPIALKGENPLPPQFKSPERAVKEKHYPFLTDVIGDLFTIVDSNETNEKTLKDFLTDHQRSIKKFIAAAQSDGIFLELASAFDNLLATLYVTLQSGLSGQMSLVPITGEVATLTTHSSPVDQFRQAAQRCCDCFIQTDFSFDQKDRRIADLEAQIALLRPRAEAAEVVDRHVDRLIAAAITAILVFDSMINDLHERETTSVKVSAVRSPAYSLLLQVAATVSFLEALQNAWYPNPNLPQITTYLNQVRTELLLRAGFSLQSFQTLSVADYISDVQPTVLSLQTLLKSLGNVLPMSSIAATPPASEQADTADLAGNPA